MREFSEWLVGRGQLLLSEVEIDKAWWGYEISGTVAEVLKILAQAPPNKECIADVLFKDEAAQLWREPWGYEIAGTVAEVMKILSQAPGHKPCTASVSFKSGMIVNKP